MCQQWFSVVGLALEVVGFLFIAWEWRHVFEHSVALRQAAVEEDYELTRGRTFSRVHRLASASMWRNTQRENLKDNKRRARMFYSGVVLVLLGFVCQAIGSLPYAVSVIGFKSCS